MGGGNAMLASPSLPIVGGGLENGKSKMLRLDESGEDQFDSSLINETSIE